MPQKPQIPPEIEDHRDAHWCREGARSIDSVLDAERFIDHVGFAACLTDSRRPGPSLYVAVCGRRDAVLPRHVQKDPETSLTWTLKDQLVRRGKLYYGKLARGKAMFIAPRMVPYFHAIWGVRRSEERQRLSANARAVLKVLRKEWEMASSDLRKESGLTDRTTFTRAIDELQAAMIVVPSEAVYLPKFTYLWTLAIGRFPDAMLKRVQRDMALREIARCFLSGAGMTVPGELARVTGLYRPEAGRGNRALVAEGFATSPSRGFYQLKRWAVSLVVVLGLVASQTVSGQLPGTSQAGVATFVAEEATISGVLGALAAKEVTCVQVVQAYLRRIDAYDDRGPALNALISINPAALETAADLDRVQTLSRSPLRPLHCIPVILKDNYDTTDMPTTGGSVTFASSIPLKDAFVVRKLRDAGAIVLAKANLTELARGGNTVSSLGGQTKNPYDLARTPGGSSGGTGAAIAASFGVAGTGSDTGQSVRSPASAQSLVGLRPTRGLVSRTGIIPVSTTQDEAGPIARTVEDAARMLDVMAGYDADDPVTAFGVPRIPPTYTAFLNRDALKGARIGVLTEYFGRESVHQEVNAVTEEALRKMSAAGAAIVRITIPGLDRLTRNIQVAEYEGKIAFNRYLDSLGPRAPVKTFDEFIARGGFHSSLKAGLESDARVSDGLNDPEYQRRLLRRDDLRQAVMSAFAANTLDAILYPHQRRLVVPIGEEQVERNGVLSNSTGFPALTFPGGFSAPTSSAPLGVPIGIEILGPDYSEPRLIALAFAFEQLAKSRRPPASTPPLGR